MSITEQGHRCKFQSYCFTLLYCNFVSHRARLCNASFLFLLLVFFTASHRIASHHIASHRIASHRIASHRIASVKLISHYHVYIPLLYRRIKALFTRNRLQGKSMVAIDSVYYPASRVASIFPR